MAASGRETYVAIGLYVGIFVSVLAAFCFAASAIEGQWLRESFPSLLATAFVSPFFIGVAIFVTWSYVREPRAVKELLAEFRKWEAFGLGLRSAFAFAVSELIVILASMLVNVYDQTIAVYVWGLGSITIPLWTSAIILDIGIEGHSKGDSEKDRKRPNR